MRITDKLSYLALLAVLITGTSWAAEVNVRDFGAVPNDALDDSDGLQKAWAACQHGDTICVPPGTYRVTKPIVWTNPNGKTVDVSGRHAVLRWYGTGPGTVLTYGGTGAPPVANARIDGLSIENGTSYVKRWDADTTALAIQNLSDSEIKLQWIDGFRRGVVLKGQVAYSKPAFTFSVKGCKSGLSMDTSVPGWTALLLFSGCRFAGCGQVGPPRPAPYDAANFLDLPADPKRGACGWLFQNCAFETNYAPDVGFNLGSPGRIKFDVCWFESKSQDSTGPQKMPFRTDKEAGQITLVGGVQDSLDFSYVKGKRTVSILSNGEIVNYGTEPVRFKGLLKLGD